MKSKNLGPQGANSLITLAPAHLQLIFLVDLVVLGKAAFSHHKAKSPSLRAILQSPLIKKLAFDVRNLSAALWHCYKVNVLNVLDVQLLELATRDQGDRLYVAGVNGAIEASKILPSELEKSFKESRNQFVSVYVPQKGGDDERLMERPMSDVLQSYSALDVAFLPELYNHLLTRLRPEPEVWLGRVSSETLSRLGKSKAQSYQGQGKKFKFGPRAWQQL